MEIALPKPHQAQSSHCVFVVPKIHRNAVGYSAKSEQVFWLHFQKAQPYQQ